MLLLGFGKEALRSSQRCVNTCRLQRCVIEDLPLRTVNLPSFCFAAQDLQGMMTFMDRAGVLFESLCPGAEVSPPIRYNGEAKKRSLEELYEEQIKLTLMDSR